MSRAREWRRRAQEAARIGAIELELPSGIKILARRPNAMQLAAWNRLPFSLAGAASGSAPAITPDQAVDLAEFLRDLLLYCCIEPRVSLNPTSEEEIHPKEIPEQDWTFIVSWALRTEEARKLECFREERSDVTPGGSSQELLNQTF